MAQCKQQMITFFTSATCNLGCKYCYNPHLQSLRPEDKKIDVRFAKVALRDFFDTNESRLIRFFGAGEPTLAFEEMEAIRAEAHGLAGSDLRVYLHSNGSFDDDIADWVERYVDILWISHDGPKSIHDANRPDIRGIGSYDRVVENVKRFALHSRIQFGVRATVCPDDFGKLNGIIDHFHSMGIKYACLAPVFSSTGLASDSERPLHLLEFAKEFARSFYYAKKKGMFVQTHLIFNFDEKVRTACRTCTPCPHVTTDGYITSCDEAYFGDERYLTGVLRELVYGRWDPDTGRIDYFPEQIRKVQLRNVDTLAAGACRDCPIIENCVGGCIPKSFYVTKDLYTPSREICNATRYLATQIPLNQGRFPFFHS